MKFLDNLILKTDSYKMSHYKQYPPKTQKVFSYLESRGGEFPETVFFGLQYLLKKYLVPGITQQQIDQAEVFVNTHMGPGTFNRSGWDRLLAKHNGKLPLIIKAVPEGTVVPTGNVLMTVENTDPEFYWLTNFMETLLLHVWYPTTVATLSRNFKILIEEFLETTGDPAGLPFKLHDFGYRGVSSDESAAMGGAAHLVNFMGTDTLAGIAMLMDYYNVTEMPGFSIPASEHSTITSWGKENEVKAMENMLKQYPEGLVACVSDSFDIIKACEQYWGNDLKEKVLNRNGTLVVRPDSGYPPEIISRCLRSLGKAFGFEENKKGYKVLPPQVRLIQGDGIDLEMTEAILIRMEDEGWSADNIAFGCGGALLQKMNRDTCRFAFKCSSIMVDDEERDVYKEPVSDRTKQSKRGRLDLIRDDNGQMTTVVGESPSSCLQTVFINGRLMVDENLEIIRVRASE